MAKWSQIKIINVEMNKLENGQGEKKGKQCVL